MDYLFRFGLEITHVKIIIVARICHLNEDYDIYSNNSFGSYRFLFDDRQ